MLDKKWICVNGIKVRYFESGQDHSNHVLLIHGLGSSADVWLNIQDSLSSNFHTICLDLPGFGASDKPLMDYTIEKFTEIVTEFVNQIGINNDQINIVGHSLGGYIAAEIAIKNKSLIKKLVLIDSSGTLEKPTPLLEDYLKAALNPSEDLLNNVFQQMVVNPDCISSKLVDVFIAQINLPNAKHAFKSTFENSTNHQICFTRLTSINPIPTLILWGDQDNLIPISHLQNFKNALENSQISIITNSGHVPFVEKPVLVCDLLLKFLLL